MKCLSQVYDREKEPDGDAWLKKAIAFVKHQVLPEDRTPDFLPIARQPRRLRWEWMLFDNPGPNDKFGPLYMIPSHFGFWQFAGIVFRDSKRRYGEWPDGILVVPAIFNEAYPLQPDRVQSDGTYSVHLFAPVKCVNDELATLAEINQAFLYQTDKESAHYGRPLTKSELPSDDQAGLRQPFGNGTGRSSGRGRRSRAVGRRN